MTDTVYKQLDYLAGEVGRLEESMIDPVEFGELRGRVDALNRKMDSLEKKVDRLVDLASEGKGGIRALWFAGSIVAGVLGWIGADKLLK